jgi:hypothetical protein
MEPARSSRVDDSAVTCGQQSDAGNIYKKDGLRRGRDAKTESDVTSNLTATIPRVFVITMENEGATGIYGNANAPLHQQYAAQDVGTCQQLQTCCRLRFLVSPI